MHYNILNFSKKIAFGIMLKLLLKSNYVEWIAFGNAFFDNNNKTFLDGKYFINSLMKGK